MHRLACFEDVLFIFSHQQLVAFLLSSKSCLLCSLRVTFCELPSHQFLCQTHFPFMRDFGKRGLRDCLCWLLGQAQFSGPALLKRRGIHLEGWQAHLKNCWMVLAEVQKRLPITACRWVVLPSLYHAQYLHTFEGYLRSCVVSYRCCDIVQTLAWKNFCPRFSLVGSWIYGQCRVGDG